MEILSFAGDSRVILMKKRQDSLCNGALVRFSTISTKALQSTVEGLSSSMRISPGLLLSSNVPLISETPTELPAENAEISIETTVIRTTTAVKGFFRSMRVSLYIK